MDLSLNRSRSESDINYTSPYFRQTIFEEIYKPHDDNSLIRYCSQMIDNGNQMSIQTSYQVINRNRCTSDIGLEKYASTNVITQDNSNKNLGDCFKYPQKNLFLENCKLESNMPRENLRTNTSYENCDGYPRKETPMEIDHESENREVDNNYRSLRLKSENLTEAKVIRKLNSESVVTQQQFKKSKVKTLIIISIIVCLIAYYVFLYTVPSQKQQLNEVFSELDNVLYQDHVKEITIKHVNILHENMKVKNVLVFVGSTGVGKTYTVNLLRKLFPKKYVIDINFLLDTHLNIDNIKASLRSDGCYFITIDNLKIDNLEDIISYVNRLPEKCMLIIPIFNIHDVDDNLIYTVNYDHFKRIKEDFITTFPSNSDVVLFNNINRDNLEIWLREQLHEDDVSKDEAITSLLEEHDVHIYGFKGLSAKINLIDL